jgi:hypothetical protein
VKGIIRVRLIMCRRRQTALRIIGVRINAWFGVLVGDVKELLSVKAG